jgi:hypothetical protein
MDLAEKEFRVVWKLAVEREFIPVRRKSERELFIDFDNGSFIECRTEENPDQLIGEGLDLAVLAEAARLKKRTWDQYIRPALADRHGRAIFTSTPRGFNWFQDFYRWGQKLEDGSPVPIADESGKTYKLHPTWRSWQIPSKSNPILPDSEIEEARLTSSPEAFAQEWEAKFIAYGGLVFPEFDETIHVRNHEFNNGLRTALFVDPGGSAPYAVLLVQITPEEEIHVLDEIYSTGRVTDQIIRMAEERWGHWILNDYNNPREELDVIIDQAAQEASSTWRLRGYRAWGGKPKIKQGIEVHHRFLRDPLRSTDSLIVPRITFSPLCKNVIKEHLNYHYPDESRKRIDTNKSELPVDIDNHTIDAMRYGYFSLFPQLFNEIPRNEEYDSVDLEELFPADIKRMQMEDSYSLTIPDRQFSLGDY